MYLNTALYGDFRANELKNIICLVEAKSFYQPVNN